MKHPLGASIADNGTYFPDQSRFIPDCNENFWIIVWWSDPPKLVDGRSGGTPVTGLEEGVGPALLKAFYNIHSILFQRRIMIFTICSYYSNDKMYKQKW